MLELRGLSAGYGRARVLFEVSLSVDKGEVVALLGRRLLPLLGSRTEA